METQTDLTTNLIYFNAQQGYMEINPAPEWVYWNDGPRPLKNLKIKYRNSKDYLRLYDFSVYDIHDVAQYNSSFDNSTRFSYSPLRT